MWLTQVSFLCDTWILPPIETTQGAGHGPSALFFPVVGDATQAPLWPFPPIPFNASR